MSCVKRYRLKTLLLLFADDLNSYIASKTEKKLPIIGPYCGKNAEVMAINKEEKQIRIEDKNG